jgi:hypothetical protein
MSSGSAHPSTSLSASGIVVGGSKFEKAFQSACKKFERNFDPEDDDDAIRDNITAAWNIIQDLNSVGYSDKRKRFRSKTEFLSYVTPGSNGEREFIKLLRSTLAAKQEESWSLLFQNGTLLSSL